jgi:hypothetical protein
MKSDQTEKIRRFIIKYQDRLIYGTDLGISGTPDPVRVKANAKAVWRRDWKYFVTDEQMEVAEVNGLFQGLKLPKEVIDKIYFHNAIKWFKPSIH